MAEMPLRLGEFVVCTGAGKSPECTPLRCYHSMAHEFRFACSLRCGAAGVIGSKCGRPKQ